MNELRLILLSIGILIILGIYLWESARRKKSIRSRVEHYPALAPDTESPALSPRKESNLDISSALTLISSYLRQARKSENKPDAVNTSSEGGDGPEAATGKQEIISFYIIANEPSGISGAKLLQELEALDMQFGEMAIYHRYYQTDDSRERLFSLANIREPGHFDPDKMVSFTTSGVAMFMCLPAAIKGGEAFEMMLDTARRIAKAVNGQLCDQSKHPLDEEKINQIRAVAADY